MKCPQCQTDNNEAAQFCGNCGAGLVKVCPRCDTNNPPQYAFCGECGYDLRSTPVATHGFAVPMTETAEPSPPLTGEPLSEATAPMTTAPEQAPQILSPTTATTQQLKVQQKIPTGIRELDELIGGGFINNKVYLISGEPGTGKTVFGLQHLFYGLITGENGIYVSTEEKPDHRITDARSLGWDFSKYVHEHKLALLDVSHHFAELRSRKVKAVDFRTIVADISKLAKLINARRIVIDPIAPLLSDRKCLFAIQEYIRNLIFAMEDNLNCTVLITSGVPSGTSALSLYGIEEFLADGIIVLGFALRDNQRVRILSVRKMPSILNDLNDHIFDIHPHRGIVLRE